MNQTSSTPSALQQIFAPTGTLRAAINVGNPVLANRHPHTAEVAGVSVDLARALAQRLEVGVEWVVFETAAESVQAVRSERADIGFFAIDPLRGEGIAFTAPYVLIEGCYMVPETSPIRTQAEVDRAGVRVTVGQGSAYDLFLSREIQHAEIVRAPSSPAVVDVYLQRHLEVAAGVKQQLEMAVADTPGHRLLPGHFMVIQQAMGMPKTRGEHASASLAQFVEDMKATGFVAHALQRHGIQGAGVAPAA